MCSRTGISNPTGKSRKSLQEAARARDKGQSWRGTENIWGLARSWVLGSVGEAWSWGSGAPSAQHNSQGWELLSTGLQSGWTRG
jgi:hypothetical protein